MSSIYIILVSFTERRKYVREKNLDIGYRLCSRPLVFRSRSPSSAVPTGPAESDGSLPEDDGDKREPRPLQHLRRRLDRGHNGLDAAGRPAGKEPGVRPGRDAPGRGGP